LPEGQWLGAEGLAPNTEAATGGCAATAAGLAGLRRGRSRLGGPAQAVL